MSVTNLKQPTSENDNNYTIVELSNGTVFKGKVENGVLSGDNSTITWSSGHSFTGQFQQNKPNGIGCFKWKDGRQYNGQVVNGRRNGFGTIVSSSFTCAGEWKTGRLNGKAKYTDKNGEYDGDWENNIRKGQGCAKYASGNIYEGQYRNGKRNGFGKMQWISSRQSYEGEWKDGVPHGMGTYIWHVNNESEKSRFIGPHKYVGEWENGQRHGHGTFYYATGAIYRGQWKNNRKEGEGIYVAETGQVVKGAWKTDRFEGGHFPVEDNLIQFRLSEVVGDGKNDQYHHQNDCLNEIFSINDKQLRSIYLKNSRKYDNYSTLTRFDMWKFMDAYGLLKDSSLNLHDLEYKLSLMYKTHDLYSYRYEKPHDALEKLNYLDFLQYLILAAENIYGRDYSEQDLAYYGISGATYRLIHDVLLAYNGQDKARLEQDHTDPLIQQYIKDYTGLPVADFKHTLIDLSEKYPIQQMDRKKLLDKMSFICSSARGADGDIVFACKISTYDYLLLRCAVDVMVAEKAAADAAAEELARAQAILAQAAAAEAAAAAAAAASNQGQAPPPAISISKPQN